MPRFEDTGLTIRDYGTRLEWEKKNEANVLHHYAWEDGEFEHWPLVADYLRGLNDPLSSSGCFAGHCDWRMPTLAGEDFDTGNTGELDSIRDQRACNIGFDACIDPIFGPTGKQRYWSSTRSDFFQDTTIWTLNFDSSYPEFSEEVPYRGELVRAVRDF